MSIRRTRVTLTEDDLYCLISATRNRLLNQGQQTIGEANDKIRAIAKLLNAKERIDKTPEVKQNDDKG